jgi:integrase/recombinase XerD
MSQAKTLTDNELNRLLQYLKKTRHVKRNRMMVLMTYWSGLRVGEVAALRVDSVLNPDNKVKSEIHLSSEQTKGKQARVVFLPEKLQVELSFYLSEYDFKDRAEPLFKSQHGTRVNSKNMTADTLTQVFKRFYREAGLENGSSHSGRRTFITNLANRGVSARVLQELAGHKHLSTTQRYIDVNDEIIRSAVELI